jgi:hypothetical protein
LQEISSAAGPGASARTDGAEVIRQQNIYNMKKVISNMTAGISALLVFFMLSMPLLSVAQDQATDTTQQPSTSSSFQDSVRFDDMDPIFYQAEEEPAQPVAKKNNTGIIIAVVVLAAAVVLWLVRKSAAKKKS